MWAPRSRVSLQRATEARVRRETVAESGEGRRGLKPAPRSLVSTTSPSRLSRVTRYVCTQSTVAVELQDSRSVAAPAVGASGDFPARRFHPRVRAFLEQHPLGGRRVDAVRLARRTHGLTPLVPRRPPRTGPQPAPALAMGLLLVCRCLCAAAGMAPFCETPHPAPAGVRRIERRRGSTSAPVPRRSSRQRSG